ncbi:MlaA family lipoprotein [Pantoea ananatis]
MRRFISEPRNAGIHFTRFFLNTVLGLGGFIDVAGKANPELARQGTAAILVPRSVTMKMAMTYVQLPAYGSFTTSRRR